MNGHVSAGPHGEDSDSLSSLEEEEVPVQPSAKALGKRKVVDFEVTSGRELIAWICYNTVELPALQNLPMYLEGSVTVVCHINQRMLWILTLRRTRTRDGAIPFLFTMLWRRGDGN